MKFAWLVVVLVVSKIAGAAPLSDVPYVFDQQRLLAAENTYRFMSSFAEYYYLLLDANRSNLQTVRSLGDTGGWCVGDAHPENFGALFMQDGSSLFTINDMDDAGPCPLVMDFLRFLVTSKLAAPEIDISNLVNAYQAGLRSDSFPTPNVVDEILEESQKGGTKIKRGDVENGRLVRDANARELNKSELSAIQRSLPSQFDRMILIDAYGTAKVGGGSSGVRRFELLFDSAGDLLHMELKGLSVPSIWKVAEQPIPNSSARIQRTLEVEQGRLASILYGVLTLENAPMLYRPKFAGNRPARLKKKSSDEKLIAYEAYTMGTLHARSVDHRVQWIHDVEATHGWKNDVQMLVEHFTEKFSDLLKNRPERHKGKQSTRFTTGIHTEMLEALKSGERLWPFKTSRPQNVRLEVMSHRDQI